MWQDLRTELHPNGLEIVTVALDLDAEAAKPWIDKSSASHPSLIDRAHRLDELFGVVNVPSGIWIDELGVIVRPPEPAWPGKSMFREMMKGAPPLPDDADPYIKRSLGVTAKIKTNPALYLNALRDWVANGAASRFALTADEVIARSRPRAKDGSLAAAHFEIGQHLWRAGNNDAAVVHFKRAHELHPENWTYKRQAWQFVSPLLQNAREVYGTDWATEAERSGPENYYPQSPDLTP